MYEDDQHSLFDEFPEHRDTILVLKEKNEHFSRMFDEYHNLNHKVLRIESDEKPTSDFYLEDQKKRRLMLKDQIYQMIQAI